MSKPSARARANRLAAQGYNCCQSTLLAFTDELGLDFEETRRLTAAFGCGVCSGNLCGAVTGSAMALGKLYEGDPEKAWDALEKVMEAFKEKQGSLLCRDICGFNPADDYDRALTERTFFFKCRPAICDAAEILEEYIPTKEDQFMEKLHDPRFPYVTVVPIFENLWALKELGSTNFLLKGTQKALLIDTAYGLTDYPALIRELVGEMPLLVVNSHAHPDHNGGNNQFEEVMAGRMDAARDTGEVTPEMKAQILDFMKDMLKPYPDFNPEAYHPGLSPKVLPLDEGDTIDLGGLKLQVIEIPGHTVGSIALYEAEKGWIFTGDTALTWEVWGQLSDSAPLHIYAESLEKLAALVPKLTHVFPAHGVPEAPMGEFMLPPDILTIYAEGTRAIVEGKAKVEAYQNTSSFFDHASVSYFEVGGMAFDPENM